MYVGGIQCLEVCRQLQTLILHTNAIDTICNLDRCRELWNIDVSGNKVIDIVRHRYYNYDNVLYVCV